MRNLQVLLAFLNDWHGNYTIAARGDAIEIRTDVPADPTERWEIRLFADGRIEAQAFKSIALESGDRLDTVIMKLRERPELAP